MATVLKTVMGASPSRVQIPAPPPMLQSAIAIQAGPWDRSSTVRLAERGALSIVNVRGGAGGDPPFRSRSIRTVPALGTIEIVLALCSGTKTLSLPANSTSRYRCRRFGAYRHSGPSRVAGDRQDRRLKESRQALARV